MINFFLIFVEDNSYQIGNNFCNGSKPFDNNFGVCIYYDQHNLRSVFIMICIKGDLITLALDGQFDVIVHGCNCFCAMGAGIAKQIRNTFPQAYAADLETMSGDKNKLGNYSSALVQSSGRQLIVINGYTQYQYAGTGIFADYGAIETLFNRIKKDFPEKRIGYPKIGAGLAKGDWEKIIQIIDLALAGVTHTFVEYTRK